MPKYESIQLQIDLEKCVTSSPKPQQLSPFSGKLFSISLLDGPPKPHTNDNEQEKPNKTDTMCVVLFMHSFAGDVASARAFVYAIIGDNNSIVDAAVPENKQDTKYWESEIDPMAPVVQVCDVVQASTILRNCTCRLMQITPDHFSAKIWHRLSEMKSRQN